MARQVFDDYYWSSDTWKSFKFGLESNWDFGMICAGGVCEEEGWVGCLSTPASSFFASFCLLILHTFPIFIPLEWITIRTPISSHNWRGIASHPQVAISSFFKALRFSGHSWVSNRTGPCSKGWRVLWGRVVGGRDFIPRSAVLSPPAGCSRIFGSNFYIEGHAGQKQAEVLKSAEGAKISVTRGKMIRTAERAQEQVQLCSNDGGW